MADDQTNNNQGRGWHGDSEGHAKAGRKGGEATAKTHDREFYENIGSEGGDKSPTQFKSGDERTQEAARKGGEASGGSDSLDQ